MNNNLLTELETRHSINDLKNLSLPISIQSNIKFSIREYQETAFKRFIYFNESEIINSIQQPPWHLLFNMATGSGKTLIMAGLMLYLHQKGYRNFLFFVHSKNIIQKTKENFLNKSASKYLFKEKIIIDNKEIIIKEINNFDESDNQNINIKFTTIQQLHLDLTKTKENSITYEDLQNKEIVLFADEAHHLNTSTKSDKELFDSWENTVVNILNQNRKNMLLEFTATQDFDKKEIADKYENKTIYKYDLASFRIDKYSKEINLLRSEYNEEDRILQALILNQYRQEIASKYLINIKPVILFKAKRTIQESEENKLKFHKLIDNLNEFQINKLWSTSTLEIVEKAKNYFDENKISDSELIKRLQNNFKEENTLSANNDNEAEENQILLNTLEDENNPIRAIFAVQKLNEGWDVLNLFDIVRLYEERDSKGNKPGKTTISEAQLIGRGARYYPFQVNAGQEKYKRKYDDKENEDLKILEELYFHTKEDSRYISELKKALEDIGIYEDKDNLVDKQLTLKDLFKQTDVYKEGKIALNGRKEKDYNKITKLSDLGVYSKNIEYKLSSGFGKISSAFFEMEIKEEEESKTSKDIKVSEIDFNIKKYALSRKPFYYFNNLNSIFPKLKSISEFIKNELDELEIKLTSSQIRLRNVNRVDLLNAFTKLLDEIEKQISSNLTEYESTNFISKKINEVFKDKTLKISKSDYTRLDGQETLLLSEPWYAYNANYGTTEEKNFIELFQRKFAQLKMKFDDIYILRNERFFKIYDKVGRAFEPDFVLICRSKDKKKVVFQVFIEPKGNHLIQYDQWKQDFLKQLKEEKIHLEIIADQYIITGIEFYNYDNENDFAKNLSEVLENK